MNTFDRRNGIIHHLQENKRGSTRDLSEIFQVSEVTIRHDLNVLEEQGWVTRIHGGAEIVPRLQTEQTFAERQSAHLAEKSDIARAAAGLVEPGETLILDSSTTAFQLAVHLKDMTKLRVITNNFHVVSLLAPQPGIEVIILGGLVRQETGSIVGPLAEEILTQLNADQAFLGAAGLSLERGLSDVDLREAQVKRIMIKAASQVNLLIDSSKFGQRAFATFAQLQEIHQLITDQNIPEAYRTACQEAGLNLTIV